MWHVVILALLARSFPADDQSLRAILVSDITCFADYGSEPRPPSS